MEHSLHNDTPVGHCGLTTKDLVVSLNRFFFFIFNVRGADVPIFCSNVCPLTGAILLYMPISLAAVALIVTPQVFITS
jgi:hypothetical protein